MRLGLQHIEPKGSACQPRAALTRVNVLQRDWLGQESAAVWQAAPSLKQPHALIWQSVTLLEKNICLVTSEGKATGA